MVEDTQETTQRHDCDTAEQFLQHLEEAGIAASSGPVCSLIFRGVGDSEAHTLVPTALRESNAERVRDLALVLDSDGVGPEIAQRIREIAIAGGFRSVATQSGLPVPEPVMLSADRTINLLHSIPPGTSDVEKPEWPSVAFLELAALAQHYGLPTRLLDWTRDAQIAAFFACQHARHQYLKAVEELAAIQKFTPEHIGGMGELEARQYLWEMFTSDEILNDRVDLLKNQLEKRLGVWLINLRTTQTSPLEAILPPYSGNPNLAAQHGILTYWRTDTAIDANTPVDRTPLEERIETWNSTGSPVIDLRLVTLPQHRVMRLLKILTHRGVHAGRLFPGYAGAAKAIEDFSADMVIRRLSHDS